MPKVQFKVDQDSTGLGDQERRNPTGPKAPGRRHREHQPPGAPKKPHQEATPRNQEATLLTGTPKSTKIHAMPIPIAALALGALLGKSGNKDKDDFQAVKGRKKKDGTTSKAYVRKKKSR